MSAFLRTLSDRELILLGFVTFWSFILGAGWWITRAGEISEQQKLRNARLRKTFRRTWHRHQTHTQDTIE